MKMAKLHKRFCRTRPSFFGIKMQEDEIELGIELFQSLPWEETDWWQDAKMESVFRYLRGSTDLRLGSLRPLFPTEI